VTPEQAQGVFRRRVRQERTAQGWSVREMAARSGGGLSAPTISRAENGHDVFLGRALAIAATLGLPLADLLEEPEHGRAGAP